MVSIQQITDAVVTGNEHGLTDPEVAAARFLRSVHLEPGNLDPERSERLKTELEAIGVELTNRVQWGVLHCLVVLFGPAILLASLGPGRAPSWQRQPWQRS
jgi:hypothetical protein